MLYFCPGGEHPLTLNKEDKFSGSTRERVRHNMEMTYDGRDTPPGAKSWKLIPDKKTERTMLRFFF